MKGADEAVAGYLPQRRTWKSCDHVILDHQGMKKEEMTMKGAGKTMARHLP